MISRGDLEAHLGSDLERLTPEQVERLLGEAADIERRWPGPEFEPERKAAIGATVRWFLGETTTGEARRALQRALEQASVALAAARQTARLAVLDGTPVEEAAIDAGVEQATLHRDLA